ncbi:unnamed protein product [Blepharisma stoltei]|uniref:Uncharacterized protein n=1 Tax=Blepharisma stoltei TaxID=1481888 RepID=A0AAU9K4N5_9CILI|nr:unnamed protein product [Blepharisma stoltei]
MYDNSEDSSPDQRSNSLAMQKPQRKNPIADAADLANRIRLLKFEHSRALKRIEETKDRIAEVINSRTRNAQDKQIREQWKQQQLKQEEELREKNRQLRQLKEDKMYQMQYELFNVKQRVGNRMRNAKEFIKRTIQQKSLDTRRENKKKRESILLGSKQANMRTKFLEEHKTQKAKSFYEHRIDYEDNHRFDLEKHIQDLETQERILLERVQRAQEIQREALEEFEQS